MTLMTGMLMLGKISTGVRSRTTGLISSSTRENTMNVYGRERASRTIHIKNPLNLGYEEFLPLPRKTNINSSWQQSHRRYRVKGHGTRWPDVTAERAGIS